MPLQMTTVGGKWEDDQYIFGFKLIDITRKISDQVF